MVQIGVEDLSRMKPGMWFYLVSHVRPTYSYSTCLTERDLSFNGLQRISKELQYTGNTIHIPQSMYKLITSPVWRYL